MTIKEFREQFFVYIEAAQHVVITSHMSPDDDSIGSVLALHTVLSDRYPEKKIRIIYTGGASTRHNVFHNFEKIEWVDDIANHLENVDTLIVTDASQYGRFSRIPEKLKAISTTIAIDHHNSQPEVFSLLLYKPEISSNAEVIYRAFFEDNVPRREIAEHLLLGILGDTGNLSFVMPSQTDVFMIVKHLIEVVGVPIDKFRSRYGAIPLVIIPLLQELVKNTSYLTEENWPPFQYTFVSRDFVASKNYSDEDISAASSIYMGQYLTRVEGYTWGFVITPRSDGACRLSARSASGSVNVRAVQEGLGTGSGHNRAAGGSFKDVDDPNACIAKVVEWMHSNRPVID